VLLRLGLSLALRRLPQLGAVEATPTPRPKIEDEDEFEDEDDYGEPRSWVRCLAYHRSPNKFSLDF